ncbi:uncharacterized protein METZ01_LOCUS422806 [marine metagenome]|uniref:Uncharacterized protein n=1 Tax=marine metagenome TaxID=408172 RepID=A0A382XFW4_9ZZZZ
MILLTRFISLQETNKRIAFYRFGFSGG